VRRILRELVTTGSVRDALLFGHMFVFAMFLPLALRRDVASLATFLEPRRCRLQAPPATVEKIQRYADAVCASRFVRAECLVRGVTRYYFLRRAGLSIGLVFGMGTVNGRLEGHCWLVKDGRPFLEAHDPEPHFTRMVAFPMVSV